MIGIYKIENKLSGKAYIGQSINIEARWKRHILDSSHHLINEQSAVIHKAINKYGLENFSFVVLEECKTENWMREKYIGLAIITLIIMDIIAPKVAVEILTILRKKFIVMM